MLLRRRRKQAQGGNALLESTLCFIFLVPLMIGSVGIGMALQRAIQTNQICRSAGHMYARGLDFSKVGNQDLIIRMATGLNLRRTGGDGVVYLTQLLQVGDQQCLDGGVPIGECGNRGQTVIVARVVFGNPSLRQSGYGNPASSFFSTSGTAAPIDYLKQSALRLSGFSTTLALNNGETAYVAETFFNTAGTGFGVSKGSYSRSIF